jgi:16S rRNA (guanine527-N7)-methyltransferase
MPLTTSQVHTLQQAAVPPGDTLAEPLGRYLDLLLQWNARINLTAIRDADQVVERHFLDSLMVLRWIPAGARRLVDVGSGAGFPGAILALARPELQVTLVESNRKKAAFLEEVRRVVPVPGLRVEAVRAEDLARRLETAPGQRFDVAVSRATLDLPEWLALGVRLVVPGGAVVGMEGADRHTLLPGAMRHEYTLAGVPKAMVVFHVEQSGAAS